MGKIIEFPINNSSSVDFSTLLEDKEDWFYVSEQELYEAYKEFYSKESNYSDL
ncbi:hypothetical protein QYB54_002298 [Clostridium perfringens]|nr:hypothetical protein [Clostridium perfringens]